MNVSFETFAALDALGFIRHAFTLRTAADTKSETFQSELLRSLGFDPARSASAEQTHGNAVAVLDNVGAASAPRPMPGVDALVTRIPNLPLVIRCADCA